MTAAAFQATYSDWKVIKGRKVVQVVFELPLELSDQAYQALGGMPVAAHEVWCGIARIDPTKLAGGEAATQRTVNAPIAGSNPARSATSEKPKRRFDEMTPAQQSGMLCQERAFWVFLREKLHEPCKDSGDAAEMVRNFCGVPSRSVITTDNVKWSELLLAYRLWQREPEVVG